MKYIILFFALLCSSFAIAQQGRLQDTRINVSIGLFSATGSADYQGAVGGIGSTGYSVDDITVGDLLVDDTNIYSIDAISITVAGSVATIDVTYLQGSVGTTQAPISGKGLIVKPTSKIGLLLLTENGSNFITEEQEAKVLTHNFLLIDQYLSTVVLGDTITQTNHGFDLGDLVGYTTSYITATTNDANEFPVGFVLEVINQDMFILACEGWATWNHGLNDNSDYYLQDDGAFASTPDADYNIFACRTFEDDLVYFDIPELIVASGAAGGGSTQSEDADWFTANTTDAPSDINDNIYTNGKIGINVNNPTADLDIESNGGKVIRWKRGGQEVMSFNSGNIHVPGTPFVDGHAPRLWMNNLSNQLSIQLHPLGATYFRDIESFQLGPSLGTVPIEGGLPTFSLNGNALFVHKFYDSNQNTGTLSSYWSQDSNGDVVWKEAPFYNDAGVLMASSSIPTYADDTAADADTNLASGAIYKVGRDIRVKP